jgi:hypothetical protein
VDSPFAKANGKPSPLRREYDQVLMKLAAQIGGAKHLLLLDLGFHVVRVNLTHAYYEDREGDLVTLDSVGHWTIKLRNYEPYSGTGFVDLETCIAPGPRY